ncbi:MAG: CatB-related O-acetyltransferase [Alphaproteobacteria bacterium]|nr:CatB-related O-acetyltransferase [Alphaproteobacteria bacterium]
MPGIITSANIPKLPGNGPDLSMGRHSYMGGDYFIGYGRVEIGNFTSIGNGITIDPGVHPLDRLSTSPFTYQKFMGFESKHSKPFTQYKNVKIGNDVYIGHKCTIMGGVTIGDGAVIGIGAVVTRDVPPFAIVGGIPARVIRYRFEPAIITDLLRLKWWDLSDEVISELPVCDVSECIEILKRIRASI